MSKKTDCADIFADIPPQPVRATYAPYEVAEFTYVGTLAGLLGFELIWEFQYGRRFALYVERFPTGCPPAFTNRSLREIRVWLEGVEFGRDHHDDPDPGETLRGPTRRFDDVEW